MVFAAYGWITSFYNLISIAETTLIETYLNSNDIVGYHLQS